MISLLAFVVAKCVIHSCKKHIRSCAKYDLAEEKKGDSSRPKIVRHFHKQESNKDLFFDISDVDYYYLDY